MEKQIQIYLSSTSFGFFDFQHKYWKRNFVKTMKSYDFNKKDIKIKLNFIDPLEVISNDAEIVKTDLVNIQRSDYIVVYLPKKLTIGTMMELTYSIVKYGANKIIVVDKTMIHRKHPWIKYWINSWCIADNEYHAAHILSEYINQEVNSLNLKKEK